MTSRRQGAKAEKVVAYLQGDDINGYVILTGCYASYPKGSIERKMHDDAVYPHGLVNRRDLEPASEGTTR